MNEQIRYVKKLVERMKPSDTIIFSHADHDGFTASALLNSYFSVFHNETAQILYPNAEHSYLESLGKVLSMRPKNFIVLDSLISKYRWLLKRIGENSLIINLDHHDNVELSSSNFVNANPHVWGIEYLNSSGLVWLVLREINHRFSDERSWVAAVGALQDYCVEDNKLLFKMVMQSGLVKDIDFESLLSSELMRIAKIINANCRSGHAEYVYDRLLKASVSNDLRLFLNDDKLLLEYESYLSEFQSVYEDYLSHKTVVPSVNLIAYDLHGEGILFFSGICEKEKSKSACVGYSNGLLTFRSLFCDTDVRLLAKLFGGGGPHSRAAGAKTTKSFEQSVQTISQYLQSEKEQVSITRFL